MSAVIRAHAQSRAGSRDLEDAFAGRWDPRRALQDDLRAVAQAVADASRAAGWWEPGAVMDAGLVVAVDLHGWGHTETFGRGLERLAQGGLAPLRPSVFLHSLPSTPASTLGLLFGCRSFQATVNTLGSAGVRAAGLASDLLQTGRLDRVVVAALSAVDPRVAAQLPPPLSGETESFRLGVAWCLEPWRGEGAELSAWGVGEPPLDWEPTPTDALLSDVPPGYRVLAAPALLAASRALQAGELRRVVHDDPCFATRGWLDVTGAEARS